MIQKNLIDELEKASKESGKTSKRIFYNAVIYNKAYELNAKSALFMGYQIADLVIYNYFVKIKMVKVIKENKDSVII